MADVHGDVQLRARGHYWRIAHPSIGQGDWDRPPFQLSRTPLYAGRPAPLFGQHNDHVYRELLGIDADAIATLLMAGALS
jgi:crotonobetainyl-CoA:carnitine CoA-transferase CaiB-like acyl-CoA transferase